MFIMTQESSDDYKDNRHSPGVEGVYQEANANSMSSLDVKSVRLVSVKLAHARCIASTTGDQKDSQFCNAVFKARRNIQF